MRAKLKIRANKQSLLCNDFQILNLKARVVKRLKKREWLLLYSIEMTIIKLIILSMLQWLKTRNWMDSRRKARRVRNLILVLMMICCKSRTRILRSQEFQRKGMRCCRGVSLEKLGMMISFFLGWSQRCWKLLLLTSKDLINSPLIKARFRMVTTMFQLHMEIQAISIHLGKDYSN